MVESTTVRLFFMTQMKQVTGTHCRSKVMELCVYIIVQKSISTLFTILHAFSPEDAHNMQIYVQGF